MTDQQIIRIGILGAAGIAHKNVAAIFKARGLEVIAVGSRTLSKAEKFIQDTDLQGKAKAYGSYEEVLQSADVDGVYLPLPTATHLQWVQKATAAGKHVLLEKPIALTREETDGILKACEEAGVQFMDGTMFIHSPRYTDHIGPAVSDTRKFGPRRSVTVTFYMCASEDFLKNDVRTRKDGDALGCYGDIGWYCIRAALWAFDYEAPVSVQAHPGVKFNRNGVVMHGGGTLLWEDGRRLTFDCGFDAVHSMFLQIAGTQGMIEVQDFCIPYRADHSKYVQKGPATWRDHDAWIEQSIEEHTVAMDRPQESHMWERFAQCIRDIRQGGKPDVSWSKQAALCNKLCIAVDQSAQQGGKLIDFKSWL